MEIPLIFNLSFLEIADWMEQHGQPAYRTSQVWQGLYKHFWDNPDHFTGIPGNLRTILNHELKYKSLELVKELISSDHQTRKYLFQLADGKLIESVWMKYSERNTLCITTQAGCAMGCAFCATGQMGFMRNLTSGEIVEQVIYFARELARIGDVVTNIVFMGMGEPFHNYENVMKAIDTLNDSRGYQFGARRMTISTVGLVPQIKRFADEQRQVNLAVSLHFVDNTLRSEIMPVNRKYSISELIQACHYYVQKTHRRITFEWALIEGQNDSVDIANSLARLLKGLLCHVNVIPLNPTQKFDGKATSKPNVDVFQTVLESNGIPCTVRLRRGMDIQAGCGQLASEKQ
jgi:23S rRNA (adenine2503-C2)-methyltransferase